MHDMEQFERSERVKWAVGRISQRARHQSFIFFRLVSTFLFPLGVDAI
jgi:hypothetical protein